MCGEELGRDGLPLRLEMLDLGQVLSKPIADGLELGTVADVTNAMVDDVHDEFGLFGIEQEPFRVTRFGSELARGNVIEQLDLAASGFVAIHGTNVEFASTLTVEADDLVAGVDAVVVGAPIRLAVLINLVGVGTMSE